MEANIKFEMDLKKQPNNQVLAILIALGVCYPAISIYC